MDDFGPDGTQLPPPPRLYPDPLAGLVTGGEAPPRAFPDALSGLVTGSGPPAPADRPPDAPPAEAVTPARAQPPAARSTRRRPPPGRSAAGAQYTQAGGMTPAQYAQAAAPRQARVDRSAAQAAGYTPAVVQPHGAGYSTNPVAYSAPRSGAMPFGQPQFPARGPGRGTGERNKGGLVGCLAVLAVLGGLFFNVVREIIEAVVKLFT